MSWEINMSKKLDYIILLLRFFLGSIFIFSSILKISDINSFLINIETYQIIPLDIIPIFAIAVCVIEFVLGIFLILNINIKITCFSTICLLLIFTGFLFYSIITNKTWSCGCFGKISSGPITYITLIRNIILILVTIIVKNNSTAIFSYNNFSQCQIVLTISIIIIGSISIFSANLIFFNKIESINLGDEITKPLRDVLDDETNIFNNNKYCMICFFSLNDCPSCLNESVLWNDIYNVHKDKITILGICNNANAAKLNTFLKHRKIKFNIFNDNCGLIFNHYKLETPVKIIVDNTY